MPLIKRPLMVLTCLLIAVIAIVGKFYDPRSSFNYKLNTKVLCEGFVDTAPLMNGDVSKILVRLHGCFEGETFVPVKARVQLSVAVADATVVPTLRSGVFIYGDIVRFQTNFHLPTDFKNPGGFKFKRYCYAREISALGFIDDPRWITKVGTVSGHFVRRWIETWREKIANSLEVIKDDETRAVARALAIGDGSKISDGTKENFRKSGLMHLLVISGLNVAFVALAVFFVFKWALLFTTNLAGKINIFKPAAVLSIATVWLYAYLTGAEVSVMRSAVMATVYLAGVVLDKRQDVLTSLALAALIILAGSPFAIFDISFQLSFVAVLSIAILYPLITQKFSRFQKNRVPWHVIQTASLSVAAAIGVTPLVAYYFHYSSFVGVFANLIAVPYAGFIITPASLIVGLLRWPAELFGYLVLPLIKMASWFASVSKPFTMAFTPPAVAVVAFYLGVMIFIFRDHLKIMLISVRPACPPRRELVEGRTRSWFDRLTTNGLDVLMILCVVVLLTSIAIRYDLIGKDKLEVTFLDVGQGSSVVVKFPDRRVMMIDGGGSAKSEFDIGKFVVAPYLWHEGISRVDWLIVTHPHSDHFKGLGFLAEEFSPQILVWNGIPPEEDEISEWEKFLTRIKKANVPIETVSNAKASLPVEILSPPGKTPPDWNTNNTSIVVHISDGQKSFLITGDIEAEAEKYLVKNETLEATVLQVPHHGSLTSSSEEFLEAVHPEFAVIQAGERNRYGFPKREILERLSKRGVKIHQTGTDGAIKFH